MTATPTVLVATWSDGLFVCAGERREHELAGRSVAGLTPDRDGGDGGALAIVDRRTLRRRRPDGAWSTLATARVDLGCCVVAGDHVHVGTDDGARMLRLDLSTGSGGELEPVRAFDAVPGRETWFAGTAVVDGRVVGPPLGVRSLAAGPDVLLAGVHVGGIPRSTDGGETWRPTIEVESDVHEVCVHPERRGVAAAAAAVGLCTSRDGGATWEVDEAGLHAPYCSAVAFVGDDVLVAAATDHFAARGAVYRRPIDCGDGGAGRSAPLVPIRGGGLPEWLDGIVDTRCIAARGTTVALADRAGNLYVSTDGGRTWSCRARDLPAPSSVLVAAVRNQVRRRTPRA